MKKATKRSNKREADKVALAAANDDSEENENEDVENEQDISSQAPSADDLAALEAALDGDIGGRGKYLSREEEIVLVNAFKGGDGRAFEKLWNGHQGYIRKIVAKEHRLALQVDFDDLMQEASIGFMEGIKRFEPEQGFRLITYAQWWVRQGVQRYVSQNRSIQKTPVVFPLKYKEAAGRYCELKEEFERAGQDWPPRGSELREAFQKETGFAFDDVAMQIARFYDVAASLDALFASSEDGSMSLMDKLVAEEPSALAHVIRQSERAMIDQALLKLRPREENILRRRYGLFDGEEQTLEEIGEALGLTRERIRQIQVEAEKKLVKGLLSISRDAVAEYRTGGIEPTEKPKRRYVASRRKDAKVAAPKPKV